MGLGPGAGAEGIEEQSEQQKEDITGEYWTPVEDLNEASDAMEALSGDTNLYENDSDTQNEPTTQDELVNEVEDTLSDPSPTSDSESSAQPGNGGDDSDQIPVGELTDGMGSASQSGGSTASPNTTMMLGVAAAVAVGAAAIMSQ